MTNSAQMKRLVAPLIKCRGDLAFSRRTIILKPVHHIARGVILDGAGDVSVVVIRPWIQQVFDPAHQSLTWTWPVSRQGGGRFRIEQPTVQSEVIEAIATDVLPRLQPISDITHFEQYVTAHKNMHLYDNPRRLITAAARGDLELALHLSRDLRAKGHLDGPGGDAESTRSIVRRRTLSDLIEVDDRAGIIALLHQWEAATAADWGLAQFWEPSPFPIEQM